MSGVGPERPLAFVTGGTGFVGSHLVEHLLAAGYRVRCLVRDPERLKWLEGLPVELAPGALEAAALEPALEGAGAVFHFAGQTRGTPEELDHTNHLGTRTVAEALARRGGGPRLVHCSSQAAAGPAPPGRPLTEEDPPAPTSAYGRSKLAGERELERLADRVRATVLRPGAVYGPRDRDTLPLFRLARRGLLPVPGLGHAPVQVVHAADVALAARLAAELPAAVGRTYFVANPEALTWRQVAGVFGRALGRHVRPMPLPRAFYWVAGLLGEVVGRGRPGALDRRRARDLTAPAWLCSVERARRELGWRPRLSLEQGFRETARWYEEQGWA